MAVLVLLVRTKDGVVIGIPVLVFGVDDPLASTGPEIEAAIVFIIEGCIFTGEYARFLGFNGFSEVVERPDWFGDRRRLCFDGVVPLFSDLVEPWLFLFELLVKLVHFVCSLSIFKGVDRQICDTIRE